MSKDKQPPKVSEGLVLIRAFIFLYFVLHLFSGIDFYVTWEVQQVQLKQGWNADLHNMPLAPHRLDDSNAEKQFWFLHRTDVSMADFVDFVENRSSQALMENELCTSTKVRTGEFLMPDSEKTKFVEGGTYTRT